MIKDFAYKWLPIVFGCHCREDRTLYYKGNKFPICARCTGELVGIILACFMYHFIKINLVWLLLIMIPMLLDGFIQLLTKYESNNSKRFITGLLFGISLSYLFIGSVINVYHSGYSFGMKIINK